MNIQPHLPTDKAGFLAWTPANEQRYELVEGRVVMMPRPSRSHGLIVSNLVVALRGRLDPHQWVVIPEFGLDSGPQTLRYPDIVVDRAGGNAKDSAAIAPVFLAEVLSPSSAETDLGDKVAEYLQIPTLLAYAVFSQDEPKAWVWDRSPDHHAPGPRVISGDEGVVRIAALKLELPITEDLRRDQEGIRAD
jgi:Uma2 family endonuclease